jgi:hypothetical protein
LEIGRRRQVSAAFIGEVNRTLLAIILAEDFQEASCHNTRESVNWFYPAKIGGRMRFRMKMCVSMLAIAALFGLAGIPARAQDKQHVVSLSELNKDTARPAQTRQANEEAVRTLLSSDQAQKTLKSANLDYLKVDKAVGQLSDEDLAKLAERSRRAQSDFAAGRISDRDLLWIIVIAIGIIVLAIVLR